jgi:hypothetical protein
MATKNLSWQTKLLCGKCGSLIGRVLPDGVRIRQRKAHIFFRPGQPPRGELDAHCKACSVDGTIDVAAIMIIAGPDRPTMRVHIRRVYGEVIASGQ